MNKSQIFGVIFTTIVTFIIQLAAQYVVMDKGYVVFGEPFVHDKGLLQPIDFINHSGATLNSFKFIVPKELDLKMVLTTKPLFINELTGLTSPDGQKLIELSGVAPKSVARMLIPLVSSSNSCCELINSDELSVKVKRDEAFSNPIFDLLKQAFLNTCIYAFFLLIFMYWFNGIIKTNTDRILNEKNEIKNDFEKTKKSLEKDISEIERDRAEFKRLNNETRLLIKRQRYMLLRRIKEYSIEIKFWRATIKKQLLNTTDPKEIESMFLSISKSLNTSSTHGNIEQEFDKIEDFLILAEEVSEKIK